MWRGLRSATASQLRQLPLASDPAVVAFIGRRINVAFTLVALIMFSVAWPTLHLTHAVMPVLLPVIAAFAAFPIMLAWANPLLGWGISLISALLIGVLVERVGDWGWTIQVIHIIEILVLTGMVYLRGPIRWVPLCWICSAAVMFIAAPPGAGMGWVVGLTVLFVICALLRVLVRSRRQLAQETELKDVAASRSAVLAERARIARDLHDVVAHRMSVVVVAAQTARYRVDDVSAAADVEFQSIAGMAREALDEVRQMLGVLRVDDENVLAAPSPGVGDIEGLVRATRSAGIDVDYRLIGAPPGTVGEAVGLIAYRIVQECLANATRHAPGARVDVEVSVDDTEVRVAVVNLLTEVRVTSGGPSEQLGSPGGHGIPGMTDRARAVGGSLVAGPDGVGAFRVAAVLPLRSGGPDVALV